MINRFLMERRCCDRLEKYVSDRVWSEPYAEYRTNTRPRILNTRIAVGDTSGNSASSYMYALAAGVLGGPREQLALPSSDGYYVYSIELNQFRSIKLSATEWIRLDTYCNKSKKDVKVYTDDGVTLWRGGIFIRQSPLADEVYVAVNARMFHKLCDTYTVNQNTGIKTVVSRADPTCVYFTKYVESDYTADDTVKCLLFDRVNVLDHNSGNSPIPTNVTTVLINGRIASGNWRNSVVEGDYAEYLIDEDAVSDVLVGRNDSSSLYTPDATDGDACDRVIVHIPKADNPDNKLITYLTCDIYLIPGSLTSSKKQEGYSADVSGVYFHQCDRADVIHQLTHNDFSIDVDILDEVAASNGFDYRRNAAGNPVSANLDYTIRVVCRSYTKKSDEDIKLYEKYISDNALINFSFGAVRDSNYCDLLYSYNHDDATILKFLVGDVSVAEHNMYFWTASWLENHSAYAVAMMNRVGPTVKNTSRSGYYRAPTEKHYLPGKNYYRKVPYQESTEIVTPGSDMGNGVVRLDTDVDYERVDVTVGSPVKEGMLEFKVRPGIQVTKKNQCANCGLFDACQYGGRRASGNTVLNEYKEELCPEFNVRTLTDYIKIFGYYHTLSLICKRVTTYYVKKIAASYPFNYEVKGTVHYSGMVDELPDVAAINSIVFLSDKVYHYYETSDTTPKSSKTYYIMIRDGVYEEVKNLTEFSEGVTYFNRMVSGVDGDGRTVVGNHYYQFYQEVGQSSPGWHDVTAGVGAIDPSLVDNINTSYDIVLADPVYLPKTNYITVRPPLALYDLAYDDFYPMVYVNGIKLDDSLVEIVGDVQYDIDGLLEQHWTYSPMFGDTSLFDTDQRRLLIRLGVDLKQEVVDPVTGKQISSGDYVTIEILPSPKSGTDSSEPTVSSAEVVFDIDESVDGYPYEKVEYKTPKPGVVYYTENEDGTYSSVGEPSSFTPGVTYFERATTWNRSFEPLGSGDKNKPGVKLLGSELVYLNGKQLVPGVDYTEFSSYSSDKFDTIIQNMQYLDNYTVNSDGHNHIGYTFTTDVTVGSAKGFVVGNWIAWDGISPIWFDNLSLLIVGGRVCSNFVFKYAGLDIRGVEHQNGEPYQVRTLVPKMVLEMLSTSENIPYKEEDDQKYAALRTYFGKLASSRNYRALIPYSHKIYSTYMLAIIKDVLNGDKDFEMYLDRDQFLEQFAEYEDLKKYDVVFNGSLSEEDMRFVDIYPVYHRHDVGSNKLKRKIAYLVEMLTPSDAMRHREHINGK